MPRWSRPITLLLQLLALLLAPSALARSNNISAALVAESAGLPGGEVTLAIHMRPQSGWHGYWLNPGDAGLGMVLDWTLPKGASAGAPRYPVPETLIISGLMNHVYEHDYAVLVPFKLPADAALGTVLPIRLKAQWLACTDQVCVPESAELTGSVTVGNPGASDPRFDDWRRALPAPLGSKASFRIDGARVLIAVPIPAEMRVENPHLFLASERVVDYAAVQTFAQSGDLMTIAIPRAKFDPQSPKLLEAVLRLNPQGDGVEISAEPGQVPEISLPLARTAPTSALSLPALLLAALAGGLLLNIMPCVFPILSLKALSLARAGESDAHARSEGLAYTAGVVLACLALGVLLLALRSAGEQVGWAFQLQEPMVVAALLVLALTITANMAGLFEFSVPGFASEGSPQGAFATGLLAAFVATPCTGPFMAAAMGAALLLPAPQALALFAALGLGLALPFLALGLVPPLRRMLPRPGAWMDRFRKAMAVPMALTAAALLWLAGRVAGDGFALALGLTGLIVLAALVVLGRRQRRGLAGGRWWWLALAAVLAFAAAGLPGMVRDADPDHTRSTVLSSQPFSEAALASARAAGKPVFAYFTADWCLTCKVNEGAAIERTETAAAFAKAGVVVLRGDWTRRDPAITRYLTRHGAAGVPLYMWYPAGAAQGEQLPQVLTPAMLSELPRR